MRVGLYSELGRRDIVAAREFAAERGYRRDGRRHPPLPPGTDGNAAAAR